MADGKQDPWWYSLVAAIVGGVLVVLGQWIDNWRKARQEKSQELREIYYHLRKTEAVMKNNYRELAMTKNHIEYWWYCHMTTSPIEDETDLSKDYYKFHLKSQAKARQVENRIGEDKAIFIAYVRKFQLLKSTPTDIEEKLEKISNLKNAQAKSFDLSLPYDIVRNQLQGEYEDELRSNYYEKLADFKAVNDTLQDLISK